jgi:hypothetical protein
MFQRDSSMTTPEQFLAAAHPEANRILVSRALRYLVDRRAMGDTEVTDILRDYTLQSTVFNYEALLEIVSSQLEFRSTDMPA